MADKFDPYREALVIETKTIWPAELPSTTLDAAQRSRIEQQLHTDAAQAADLQYVRLHAGFCRQITVTAADLERLAAASP